jgi:hypothetical protein
MQQDAYAHYTFSLCTECKDRHPLETVCHAIAVGSDIK